MDPVTGAIAGIKLSEVLLGNIVGTIGGLIATYGDNPQVQGITSSLYSLLGQEAASEVAARVELENARRAAEGSDG